MPTKLANRELFAVLTLLTSLLACPASGDAEEVAFSLRYQTETGEGTGRFHQLHRTTKWEAGDTAVIVCDVWDLHHSHNAVRRVEEMGPRLNAFVEQARRRGMTIIHAPSDCMRAYEKHPARLRAKAAPAAANLPSDITSWCSKLPVEAQTVYPLDQSDGGDDDAPADHAAWTKKLKALGRDPGTPWRSQSDLIKIDAERDFISDKGDEIWNILTRRGIKNVLLTGVHTNMCVLGRPFGLRQLARHGKQVALVRDLTDTMYNPARWPYVNHFTGTDLIVSHIERWICPTLTSDQLLGGQPFRFRRDKRPRLVMLIAEVEYETNQTLPEFAAHDLGQQFQVSLVFDREKNRHDLPGLEVLDEADALLISVRRRPLPGEQLRRIKKFIAAGKPVIGIRTASHAFASRRGMESAKLQEWPELDAQVLGGNYHNHHGNKLVCTVKKVAEAADHPILSGSPDKPFTAGGSLYQTSPLAKGATALLMGSVPGHKAEPVAWTFNRADGGRSFYTSLGHPKDFANPVFRRLLYNGICWAADVTPNAKPSRSARHAARSDRWRLLALPGSLPEEFATRGNSEKRPPGDGRQVSTASDNKASGGVFWLRCGLRLTETWLKDSATRLEFSPLETQTARVSAWLNGVELSLAAVEQDVPNSQHVYDLPRNLMERNDVNLLVLRLSSGGGEERVHAVLRPPTVMAGQRRFELRGNWQVRRGKNTAWRGLPLPARYGIGADMIFEPEADASLR